MVTRVARKSPAKSAGKRSTKSASNATPTIANNELRIRMYRVGFGDFFLLTVPTPAGSRYILIDCGVHAGNIGSMGSCVQNLIAMTGGKLALVIITHYHADHLSGFATFAEAFAQFEVEAVWITNRLDPNDDQAMKLKSQISALALHLKMQLQLSARDDEDAVQAGIRVENALGADSRGNDKAMQLITSGFANSPPIYYYEAGQTPTLPASLQGELTARILGPAPKRVASDFSASDNRTEQYLAAVDRYGLPDGSCFEPFGRNSRGASSDYPPGTFRPWTSAAEMEAALQALQPDVLAAAAESIDGTLNNQSLVVLFTWRSKRLLFVGDAQWGNWAYWLYGEPVKAKTLAFLARPEKYLVRSTSTRWAITAVPMRHRSPLSVHSRKNAWLCAQRRRATQARSVSMGALRRVLKYRESR